MSDANEGNTDWYSNEIATFGDRLAGAREAVGLSQAELARRLGVKLKTVRAWEDDMAEPRANRLQMLAGLLNVSIMWLLNGEGDGLDAPAEEAILPADVRAMLTEIRQVKTEMNAMADRLGLLEKRLRATLKEGA
ncbi:helix-turn-helix domain-containing protein [Actibacterium sp. MT2.3-13A]|uniref:helix-turn-helix domain-containing protein n=1 Tax=Actibacterium sp. MT2.3-13A TaxID=2828332 RepID=UPI001BA9AE8F|nr:helix-turn-helix domain-containing protein [Actibacterium sp. MT2.3-13A]